MCEKHNVPLSQVCSEFRCSACYEEMLLTEKVFAHKQDYKVVLVPKGNGHNQMVMTTVPVS